MASWGASIDLSGPLFQRDPGLTLQENIRKMMDGVAAEGEAAVKANWTNSVRGRGGVTGRTRSLSGRRWDYTAQIAPQFAYPWPGGGEKRYRGGRNKLRTRSFRATAYRLRSARAVIAANLTKGLGS